MRPTKYSLQAHADQKHAECMENQGRAEDTASASNMPADVRFRSVATEAPAQIKDECE